MNLIIKIMPTNNNKLINRLITNKLIKNLFSYLFHLYLTFEFYLLSYLVFININNFISCKVLFFIYSNIQFFVS